MFAIMEVFCVSVSYVCIAYPQIVHFYVLLSFNLLLYLLNICIYIC